MPGLKLGQDNTGRPANGRANPDPVQFGTRMVSAAQQQLQGILAQIPAVKGDPEQEAVLQFLLREIKKIVGMAKKQNMGVPVEAEVAVNELTKTLVGVAALLLFCLVKLLFHFFGATASGPC